MLLLSYRLNPRIIEELPPDLWGVTVTAVSEGENLVAALREQLCGAILIDWIFALNRILELLESFREVV